VKIILYSCYVFLESYESKILPIFSPCSRAKVSTDISDKWWKEQKGGVRRMG
jgi:hypothetical protein